MSKNRKEYVRYSVDDKVNYHQKVFKSCSGDKKNRSANWLDGYNDPHAETNYQASKNELKNRIAYMKQFKKKLSSDAYKDMYQYNRVVLIPFLNGCKAKITKGK